MGGDNSKTAQYKEKIDIHHPKFTSAQLIQTKDKQELIETFITVANEQQIAIWEQKLKEVPVNFDSIILPVKHQFTKEGYCGSSGVVRIQYHNFPFILADEIINREGLSSKSFQESELWYLIYTLISVAGTFHASGFQVGDIRPENVFINEDGQVKVACLSSWPSQQTNYMKTFWEKEITYLSPQQVKDIQFGKKQSNVDYGKAEAFSIGLTCLDAAILSDSKSLYTNSNHFNFQKLEQKMKELYKTKYSQLLINLIENLCHPDDRKRSSCIEIYEWLRQYQEQIINLQQFQVKNIPAILVKEKTNNSSPKQQKQHYPIMNQQPFIYNAQQIVSSPPVQQKYYYQNEGVNRTNTIIANSQPVYQQPLYNQQPIQQVNYGHERHQNYYEQPINNNQFQFYRQYSQQNQNERQVKIQHNSGTTINSKSYFDRIDAQLRQSRKNFPS